MIQVPRLAKQTSAGGCFICEIADGTLRNTHDVVYEDDSAIAFLAKWPPLWGLTLVCPRSHREDVTADFSEGEYVELQRVVRRVGNALQRTVPCARLYVLSLGGRGGNSHVHWHLAPLPPGVHPLKQQCRAYEELLVGRLDIPNDENARLAAALRAAIESAA